MKNPGSTGKSWRKRATCHPDRWQAARGLCHPCYNRTWNKEHPEKARATEQKKRRVNGDKRRAQARARYILDSSKILTRNREYQRSNPEKLRAQKKAYSRTEKGRYIYLKNQAKARGLECSLSFIEYCALIQSPCFYCGGKLPEVGTGTDRIDSNRGYVSENVHPCCKQCNNAKNSSSEDDFKEWAMRLFNSEWFSSSKIRLEKVA
jgi:hypothetical protein